MNRTMHQIGRLITGLLLLAVAACTQTPAALPAQATPPSATAATIPPTPTAAISTQTAVPIAQATTPPAQTATAVPPPTLIPPQIENPRRPFMARQAEQMEADYLWLNPDNSGVWRYAPGSFLHPIALEVSEDTAYLLDGGRVLILNLAAAKPPQLLLAPGEMIDGHPVIEPLDLALTAGGLLVLDRVGDVYRYDLADETWSLARYDRPIGDMSSHYYVTLADGVLLEPNYNFALQFSANRPDRFWLLPEQTRPIDTSVTANRTYALLQDTAVLTATIALYQDATLVETFHPTITLTQPRQIVATDTAVYVLDQGGERLLALHPKTGALLQLIQPPPISAFWSDGSRLILAGREQLYFVHEPDRLQTIAGGPTFNGIPPHDPEVWTALGPFIVPVQGTQPATRELQMPGAPRHYRLGVHEGADFYWGAGTPVRAVADGTVIRATHEYEAPDEEAFNRRREELKERGYSTAEDLDFYRGMQVWIEHEDGTVARYVHLSAIEEEIVEGTAVTQGQMIGAIGNSGSPASVKGPEEDAHLHFELWFNGHYLGQYLRPVEIRELLAILFDPD